MFKNLYNMRYKLFSEKEKKLTYEKFIEKFKQEQNKDFKRDEDLDPFV